ncbi:MAG: hypothetical protein JNK57_18705 [Planctomycetaceae bacterium]|nr:hypothetical protein [Planctomycetaceae bacterium]
MRVQNKDRPSNSYTHAARDVRFPLMDCSSAVSPTLRMSSVGLALAYYLPDCEDSAVVAFEDVECWFYGYPGDERLHHHKLWGHGLDFYWFHQLEPARSGSKVCWLATFHDGTFEVVAGSSQVLQERVKSTAPCAALTEVLGPGSSEVL